MENVASRKPWRHAAKLRGKSPLKAHTDIVERAQSQGKTLFMRLGQVAALSVAEAGVQPA